MMENLNFDLSEDGRYWPKREVKLFLNDPNKYEFLSFSRAIVYQKYGFTKDSFELIFQHNSSEKIFVHFIDCNFNFLGDLSFSNADIILNETSHNGHFSLKNCDDVCLSLEKCKGIGKLAISNCNKVNIAIINIQINNVNLKSINELIFKGSNLKNTWIKGDSLEFNEIEICNSEGIKLTLNNSFGKSLIMSKTKGDNLDLLQKGYDLTSLLDREFHIDNIFLEELDYKKIRISNYEDNILSIRSINIFRTSNVSLNSLVIDQLHLQGETLENINVSFTKISWLNFNHFKSKNNVVFNIVEIKDGSLTLNNSILKDVEINPSFLHSFKNISYENSSIEGLRAYSFKLIEPKVIRESEFEPEEKVNFCRELNALMISQNNRHYSTIYKALELEYRTKVTDKSLSWFDRQVLNLNFWSNAHGTKPQRALFWILFMIVLQFGVINFDLYFQTCLPYEAGFDFLSQNYSYFIKPLTFLSEVEEDYRLFHNENMQVRFNSVTKGFDFLFKIFYAYLLYQFVAAFRKFNK